MGAKLRETRQRIRTVQSTMKITRAMELIAASRILKAQQRVAESRPYTERVASASAGLSHPLLEERPDRDRAGVFVVTSDRGLAGAYSSSVLRRAEELFGKLREEGKEPKVFVAGRKGLSYYRFRGRPIEESWTNFSETPRYENAKAIAGALMQRYGDGEIDEIHGVYTAFESPVRQRAVARRFVPMVFEETDRPAEQPATQYEFEPEPEVLLDALLPRYVETRVFTALLEAAAAEHAARRRAMSAATENADELIKVLTRRANQARQTEITTEIMEIVGGAEALRQAAGE